MYANKFFNQFLLRAQIEVTLYIFYVKFVPCLDLVFGVMRPNRNYFKHSQQVTIILINRNCAWGQLGDICQSNNEFVRMEQGHYI